MEVPVVAPSPSRSTAVLSVRTLEIASVESPSRFMSVE